MELDEDFFSKRRLSAPDGRPLHAYYCDDAEYARLIRFLAMRVAVGQVLPSTARWFVIWAAEYIRRNHAQGLLSWDFVFSGLRHEPDRDFGVALVEEGLPQWGRKVRRRSSDGNRMFLYTLLAEGGLPDAFLVRASGYNLVVINTISELSRNLISAQEEALSVTRFNNSTFMRM